MSKTVWDAPNPDGWPRSGGRFSFDEGAKGDTADASFSHVVEAGGADRIDVGSGDLLLNGSYDRDGSDLILSDGAGHTLLLKDYFLSETPADLVVGEGMRLDGDLVARLAGGLAPGQVAQAATLGGDAVAAAIGTVTKAAGTVTVIRTDGTEVTVQSGDPIFQGDVVATSADGGVGITFLDGSAFSLGGSGRMVLDEMVYDPGTGDGSSSVSLVSGVFSFVSGEIAKSGPDAMAVTTPVGTIGIRGTKGVITLKVPAGTDLGDLGALSNRAEALGVTFEVVLLPETSGFTGEIVFTGLNGQSQTLNAPYDGIKVSLSQVLDQVELSVSRFSASQQDMDNSDQGRSLDFLPDSGSNDQGNGNDQGGIDTDGDGRPQLTEIIGQDPNYSDPYDVLGKGTGGGPGGNSVDVDAFVKEVLKAVDNNAYAYFNNKEIEDTNNQDNQGTGGIADTPSEENVVSHDSDGRIIVAFSGGVYDASDSTESLNITGSSTGDTITTGSGNDLIFGGAGNDTIKTNGGNDIVYGGSGADTIIGGSGHGDDTYIGGSSETVDDSDDDWVKYPSATRAITVNLSTGTATGVDIDTDVLYGIEHVLGGDGSDTITGNSKANILQGGTGDDTLDGGAGNDTLEGGDGDDSLVYSSGTDTYSGGSGTDTVLVKNGMTLDLSGAWQSGSSSLERLELGSGANTLSVGSSTSWSSIFGSTLYVKAGSDDTVTGSGWSYGGTVVSDGVVYNSWTQSGATLNVQSGAIQNFTSGDRTVVAFDGGTYDGSTSTANLLVAGSSAGDTITTGSGNDLVYGGDGNDTIKTNGGDDIVYGGAGADVIIGGSGHGNDTYYGGSSATVDDSDSDWIKYPSATHAITVDLSTGRATGTDIDTDVIFGIENVLGGDGSDSITGNFKANILQGGTGNDTLDGGAGSDTLQGGLGNDTLVYSSGTDTYAGGSGTDTLLVRNGTTLDLGTAWQSGSSSLESITLGSGANTLAIGSLTSWSSIFGTTLTVNAGSDDTVSGSGWTYEGTVTSGGVTYNSWSQNGHTVNIQSGAQLSGFSTTSTITWDHGADTTAFSDAANWDSDSVPGSTDVAAIQTESSVVLSSAKTLSALMMSASSSLQVKESLTLTNGGSIENGSTISLDSGGTLETDGTLTFDGRLYLGAAGTLSGDGVIHINRDGILLPSDGSVDIDGLTLNLNNDLKLGGSFVQSHSSTVVYAAHKTLSIKDTGSVSGSGTFQILGTVNVDIDGEEGSFAFGGSNTVLSSGGAIEVETGTLSLGSGTYAGAIEAGEDGTVTLTGAQTYNSGISWSGYGTFLLSSGTIALNTNLSTDVALEFSGSNRITGMGNLVVDTFDQSSAGTLDFDATLLKVADGGEISGSTLKGDGTLQIDGGTFTVSTETSETTTLSLDTVVKNGGTLEVLGGNDKAITLSLSEASGASGSLTIDQGGKLYLKQSSLSESVHDIILDGGFGTITNNGSVFASNDAGQSTGAVTIKGTFVQGTTGTLTVQNDLYFSPGVGRVVDLSNGTVDLASGHTIYVSSGTLATGSGTTYAGSGTRTLQFMDGTTWRMGADYTINASTFKIGLSGAVSIVAAAGASPTLTNAGTALFFSDDTIGVDVVNSGRMGFHGHDAAAGTDGGSTLSGNLTNSGTIMIYNGDTYSGQYAGNPMTTTVGGTIDNSGLFLFDNGASFSGNLKFDLGTHAFNNSGTVQFVDADNTTYEIESTFNNSGTVDLQHDATFSGGNFTNQSGATILLEDSSTLTWDPASTSSVFANDSGGLIQGSGTITLHESEAESDMTLFNSGTISPGIGTGSNDSNHGSLTINGNLTAKATSLVVLDLDTYGGTGHDTLSVSNTFTLGGTLDIHRFSTPTGEGAYSGYLTAGTLVGQFDQINGMNDTEGATTGSYALHPVLNGTTELKFQALAVTAVGSDFDNDNHWQDVVIGTSGNDKFLASGTHSSGDFFYGGDGNDTVTLAYLDPASDYYSTDPNSYSNLYFDFLDGGAGTDTLKIEQSTNLTSVSWEKVQGFEIIDFNAAGGTLTIDDTIVKALASGTNEYLDTALSSYNSVHNTSFSAQEALVIDLADGDTLNAVSSDMESWEDKGTIQLDLDGQSGDESYTVYTHGDATIYVHDEAVGSV
ncbi:hypothetical protein [Rhodospirillum sp. A1_3_36]|uniref:hypothetical protein n=1 Tax=Rhodospirillum sp. A1_3_36 TaxID=3391666 RepID=UPI0039A686C7